MGVLDLRAGTADVHDLEADRLIAVAHPIALPVADQRALVVQALVGGRNLVGAR